ncbi:diacylglycerol/lipid kinase family protein [Methylomagnum sp.]
MDSSPTIILNPASGGNHGATHERCLAEFFAARGITAHIEIAANGEEITRLVRQALAERAGPIVAGGGDGTVNAVASLLADTGRVLGVLPLGTLNHFAKDLGLPQTLEDAAQVLIDGTVIPIDVGEVNGQVFINNSSLGLYPALVHKRERLQERLSYRKWPAFAWASLSALRRYPFVEARIRVDGEVLTRRSPFIFIGNNEYCVEGFDIGARARLDVGWLWLYTVHDAGRWGLIKFAINAVFRRLLQQRDFDRLSAKEIVIASRHQIIRVATDGEVQLMRSPLRYRIRPGALRVLVPRQGGSGFQPRP